MWEWEKPGKLHIVLQRFKSNRKQLRRGGACASCRKVKRKCDESRPCARCIQIGKAETCTDEFLEEVGNSAPQIAARMLRQVKRSGSSGSEDWLESFKEEPESPLPFVSNGYERSVVPSLAPGPAPPPTMDLVMNLMGKMAGAPIDRIQDIFNNITPELYGAIFETVGLLVTSGSAHTRAALPFQSKGGDSDPLEILDSFPRCGYARTHIDYETGLSEFRFNRNWAKLYDLHPEELLLRYQLNEINLVWSEFDQLCEALQSLPFLICGSPNGVFWEERCGVAVRRLRDTGEIDPVLHRLTYKLTYNDLGSLASIETWCEPLSAVQYDELQESAPHKCRPLQRSIGDLRSGAELLREYPAEYTNHRIGAMAYNQALRQNLNSLATALRKRFQAQVADAIEKRVQQGESRTQSCKSQQC